MLFYIINDNDEERSMLTEIVEQENYGTILGESSGDCVLDKQYTNLEKADILLIDLLEDTETIHDIKSVFKGKIIVLSENKSKTQMTQAFSHSVMYYMTKPINQEELSSVIQIVIQKIDLEKSVESIHQMTKDIIMEKPSNQPLEHDYISYAQYLLSELSITGENGYQDLLDIIEYLSEYERDKSFKDGIPNLKDIILNMIQKKGLSSQKELEREIKTTEQRIRRSVHHSLTHLASLGLEDFMNPTFERYAPKFFFFPTVQQRMNEIKNNQLQSSSNVRVNTKKFILVLYFETQRLMLKL